MSGPVSGDGSLYHHWLIPQCTTTVCWIIDDSSLASKTLSVPQCRSLSASAILKAISIEEHKGSPCEARRGQKYGVGVHHYFGLADSWKRRRRGGEGEEGKEEKGLGDGREKISSYATLLTYGSRLVDGDSLYGGWYWPQAEAFAVHVNLQHCRRSDRQATTPT